MLFILAEGRLYWGVKLKLKKLTEKNLLL
jgi:hypothetical protein